MNYEEKSIRNLEFILDQHQKLQVIKKHLLNQRMFIKTPPFTQEVRIVKVLDGGNQLVLTMPETFNSHRGNRIAFFRMLAAYIEVNCIFMEQLNNGNCIFKLESLCVAKKGRDLERLPMPIEIAYVTNILCHRSIIDETKFALPNIVFESFEKYKRLLQNTNLGDVVIDIFRGGQKGKFESVKKNQKSLFIADTSDPNCFRSQEVSLNDCEGTADADILSRIREYRANGILSELIVPILYPNDNGIPVSIGFIQMRNKSIQYTPDDLSNIESLSQEITNLILSSNSTKIANRFKIMDISNSGMRLKIDDPAISEKLSKRKELNFDIVFRGQTAIPLSGTVKWTAIEKPNTLYLGLEFKLENGQELNRKRLEANLTALRKEYLKILNKRVS
ncbi:PF07614 family protein [Leptospira fainei serovar Hurstbridge str. BUT 6]|uniref:PF07614 family protein n=1 Tax=Leptospira fainei serovar Hurstbridge str. BUT 6 TaxID=1193011 RepID=S3UPT9_9LEPT|nr:PilZ domain-containing protein [Leptospira fainei]EPG72421.1 PF07614 family protein [Leptospira fainei serovar Hurstbridge str. BUT 6]